MSQGTTVDRERVYVFEIDNRYLFKYYFDGEAVFHRLADFYNNQQYRFEVPEGDFEPLAEFLGDNGYDLKVVDSIAEFVVLVEKYTAHPDNIFKESVMQRSEGKYNFFLMTDTVAVDRAVHSGAERLSESDRPNPFE